MADVSEGATGGTGGAAEAGGAQPALAPAAAGDSILSGAGAPTDGEGAKPAEGAAPAKEGEDSKPGAFDADKFQPPEGLELSDSDKTFIGDMAKKHGLSNEAMTDLVGEYANRLKAVNEAATAAYVRTQEDWQKEIKADKDIGGDKLPGVLETIGKVMSNPKITDPKFKEALNLTGAGNNPAILKTFYNLAKLVTEGGAVLGEPISGDKKPSTGPQALYPNLPTGA